MPTLRHLHLYIKQYGYEHKSLYLLSFMILFYALFDGVITYITPIVITETGISLTFMGIILGSSSIFGAAFDFLLCKVFENTSYRKCFLLMFAICLVYPLILWNAKTVFVFLIAMALWGFYFDLKNFGNFNFVGRHTKKSEHASSFGIIGVFGSLGYLLASILAGITISEYVGWNSFLMMWFFLAVSIIFFILLVFSARKNTKSVRKHSIYKRINFMREFSLWGKIGKIIFPVLILTMFLWMVESFFWTIGPVYAESVYGIFPFAGFFVAAYALPPLFAGWIVGPLTKRLGKKRTAFISFLIGSIMLSSLFLFGSSLLLIVLVFLISIFISLSFPAISGAYADYISETHKLEKEIEGLEDFFTNIGYIIGPMIAGFLADAVGILNSFSVIGVCGVFVSIILMKITPKHININRRLRKKK